MEWQQAIGIILIGTAAGILGGLLGLGGAVVVVPALVMVLGFSQQAAQGTALVMMVLPVGALAAWQYYKAGNVNMPAALLLAAAFFVSSYIGARAANHVPQELLKKLFAVLLILIALKILFLDKLLSR